ncbi:hypothetical protein L1887_12241 [Cichorium endivia]|nr:hypothetical protein L1887_12241 [Cichorium endivia]
MTIIVLDYYTSKHTFTATITSQPISSQQPAIISTLQLSPLPYTQPQPPSPSSITIAIFTATCNLKGERQMQRSNKVLINDAPSKEIPLQCRFRLGDPISIIYCHGKHECCNGDYNTL